MIKWFQTRILENFAKRTFRDDKEIFLYFMTFAANIFAFTVHVSLLVVFLFAKNAMFSCINLVSVLIYFVAFFIVKNRKYSAFAILFSLEVIAYSVISNLLIGMHTHTTVYFLMVIAVHIMVSYFNRGVRLGIILLSLLLPAMCLAVNHLYPPTVELGSLYENILGIINTYIMLGGISLLLYINNFATVLIDKLEKVKIQELSDMAHTDPLTGLYNRRFAKIYFENIKNTNYPICIAMLDIDDFKITNDTLGHSSGDDLLVFLSNLLIGHLRKSDTVFRWGGEEFLLVLEYVQLKDAIEVLEKIRKVLEATPIPTRGGEVNITVTIGIAEMDVNDVQNSIELSDKYLYLGKQSGKNKVVSHQTIPSNIISF